MQYLRVSDAWRTAQDDEQRIYHAGWLSFAIGTGTRWAPENHTRQITELQNLENYTEQFQNMFRNILLMANPQSMFGILTPIRKEFASGENQRRKGIFYLNQYSKRNHHDTVEALIGDLVNVEATTTIGSIKTEVTRHLLALGNLVPALAAVIEEKRKLVPPIVAATASPAPE